NFLVVGYVRGIHMVDFQTACFNGGSLSECMDNFIFRKSCAGSGLYAGNAFSNFCCGGTVTAAVLHLNNQHRPHVLGMLRFAVVVPMLTFVLPFVSCCLENDHIINGLLLRVGDDDSVFQKT